ncbi:MAG: sigma-70 family RNA polymerase sigma factor [Rikenellaceae bacterium]
MMTITEFNIYIENIRGQMLRFAVAILQSEPDAQDVVSGVVERLWKEREKLKVGPSSVSFAMTAVRNGCYDRLRFKKRWRYEEPNERNYSYEQSIDVSDKINMVRHAISLLPDRQREVLHLKDIEGYETKEIACIFNIEETNVRMILSRARIALKNIIIKHMKL